MRMNPATTELARIFTNRFNQNPRLFYAPGRINVIGEHTDYNDGFVMPFAIDRGVTIAVCKRNDNRLVVESLELGETAVVDLDQPEQCRRGTWLDYVEGVARCIAKRGKKVVGTNVMIGSTLPIGAGLSSSAALEVGLTLALSGIAEDPIDPIEVVRLAQEVEHRFVGTQSGIMDPYIAVFGQHDTCLLIDCRTLQHRRISILGDVSFVVCDSGIKHQLASSEYNRRKAQCVSGLQQIQKFFPRVTSLRDVEYSEFLRIEQFISEPERRRCRHVITENQRTLEAAEAFERQDFRSAGELMYASHDSLRNDYEVSCDELDALVDATRNRDRVFGARMTGGGFGGCTINLLPREVDPEFEQFMSQAYTAKFGIRPAIFKVRASDGAHEVNAIPKLRD